MPTIFKSRQSLIPKISLKTQTTLDDNGCWSITIDASGIATIKAQGTNTRNWLRYNSASSLFACYASGQADISIYKLSK